MLTVTLETYLISSVDNNSNNVVYPSLVTRIQESFAALSSSAANDSCWASCQQVGLQRSAKPSEQTLLL